MKKNSLFPYSFKTWVSWQRKHNVRELPFRWRFGFLLFFTSLEKWAPKLLGSWPVIRRIQIRPSEHHPRTNRIVQWREDKTIPPREEPSEYKGKPRGLEVNFENFWKEIDGK